MRFNSIVITNFRQYKNLEFDFKLQGEHDLHVIVGRNGMGKTNILNAITWCLYNKEPHLGDASRSLPRLNLDSRKEALESGQSQCFVSVKIFADDNGQMITYNRKLPVNTTTDFEYQDEFTVTVSQESGDTITYEKEEAISYVERYMPEKIRQYFYFDGEQLDNYFTSDQRSTIKDSIHAISRVDIVTRIGERLGKVILKKQQEASAKDPDVNKINCEKKEALQQIEDCKTDVTELETQISNSEKVISDNTEFLKGQDNLPELEEKYQKLMIRLKNLEDSSTYNEIFTFIKEFKIVLSFYPYAKSTLSVINEKENSGLLPPNIDRKMLVQMLSEHKCLVCDRVLEASDEERISDLIDKIQVSSETSHLLMNIKNELERIIKRAKGYSVLKEKLLERMKQNENDKKEVEDDLQKIDNELSRFSDKIQIMRKHTERTQHKNLLKINNQKIGVAKDQLRKTEEKLQLLDNKLSIAMSKQKECKRLNQLIEFSKKAKAIIEQIENEMTDEVKCHMQDITWKYFTELIWKKNTYERIRLDDKYQLDLFHIDGYSCVGSCGAAERSLLALSFTLALQEVSGFNSLLFIDTPVARVSDLNRINFANVLSEVSRQKQIIMTFSPDEYSDEIRNIFEKYTSTSVKLFTDDERVTQVD